MTNPKSKIQNPKSLVRAIIRRLHPYVPGEQPKIKGLIKLNTNENPYPPSPKVLSAIQAAVDARLRLYPNPTAQALRVELARFHGCAPENILIGNGSDELLALATRAFVEPDLPGGSRVDPRRNTFARHRSTIQYFIPSYSLYPVLAAIHGARTNPVPLDATFALPGLPELHRGRKWDFQAALTFVTTPNAPSGRGYSAPELEALCRAQRGVVVLDEAYVDFASENALKLGLRLPNVLVARTFSKAYSLCFLRVGYFVGPPELIAAVDKIRDSYNVNGLGQIGALATLKERWYYRAQFRKIIATRERLSASLKGLGFEVFPSQTNFILVRPPRFPAKRWLERLRAKKILVRWFSLPEVKDFLRISIGTDAEIDALVKAAEGILGRSQPAFWTEAGSGAPRPFGIVG
ncbi:MAG: aminotransferase class I/II-fold pyridoxal phosphate-dependent enzyme [Verrucomicrobia bacterium]|nr:aminotransferase class I/II-fold pyridoxal phosphate-dependent enzyme [Verrucomicrobiota bacterium]